MDKALIQQVIFNMVQEITKSRFLFLSELEALKIEKLTKLSSCCGHENYHCAYFTLDLHEMEIGVLLKYDIDSAKQFFSENDANLSALKTDQLVQSFVGECCNLIMGGIKKILNEHDIGITDQFSEVVLPIHCPWNSEEAQKIFDGYATENWQLLHKSFRIEGRTALLINEWSQPIRSLPTTDLNLENLDKQEEIEFFF